MVIALAMLAGLALAALAALAWSCFCDRPEGSPVLARPIPVLARPIEVTPARVLARRVGRRRR